MLASLLFGVVFVVLFCQVRSHEECENPDFKKTNVVIFFTKPNIDLRGGADDAGIKFLKFPVQGRVQTADGIPEVYKKLFSIDPKSSSCEKIFDKCLMNLIDWASNVKHMVTATISTSETKLESSMDYNFRSPDNNLQGIEFYRYSIDQPKEMIYNKQEVDDDPFDPFRVARNPDIFGQLPLKRSKRSEKGLPVLKFENYLNDFPVIEAFNPLESLEEDRSIYDTDGQDIPKLEPDKHETELKNDIPDSNNKFSAPNNKMNKMTPEQKRMIQKNTKDIINAFDIFSKIRDMFLGSFFTPNAKHSRALFREENSVDPSVLGTVEVKPMYQLVRNTLENLQTQSCEFQSEGYLLVVMGGNLSEIADPFSDLVQSVKYVLEHTDHHDTLVLVSCFCRKKGVIPPIECTKRKVPFYAQGPNSEEIKKSLSMVDIFENLRSAISSKHWSKNHSGRNKYPIEKNKSNLDENEFDGNENIDDEDSHVLVGGGRMIRSASSAQRSTSTNFVTIIFFIFLCFYQIL